MKKLTEKEGGSICGGVISLSQHMENIKKHGVWADTMSFIMPDEEFEKYIFAKKSGDEKKAEILFNRFAHSQI